MAGLTVGTMLTLVPVLYAMLHRVKAPSSAAAAAS